MYSKKIIDPDKIFKLYNSTKPIVLTNGVFDILHAGHVSYLQESKQYGETLIVALNSDESVKNLNKGDDRPINSLKKRMIVISALESVDYVTWFTENTPLNLIKSIKPDVITKGGDWEVKKIVGYKEVKSWGGKVYSIKFKYNSSTTSILKKIRAS